MTWILRAVAIAMLAFAFLPRGAGSSTRTLIIALEGAELERFLSGAGNYPAVESLIESGVYGSVAAQGAVETTFGGLVAVGPSGDRSGRSVGSEFLWDRPAPDGSVRIVVGFGKGEPILQGETVFLPGPDPATGFAGSNTGRIQNLRELEKKQAVWPYGDLAADLAARAAELDPGEASEWVEVEVAREGGTGHGVFRLRLLDDEVAWLTPIFTRTIRSEAGGALRELGETRYVPDAATWAVPSSRVGDYFYQHVLDVTDSRAEAAMALAAAGDWSLLVYADGLLAPVTHAVGAAADDDVSAQSALAEAYAVVDRRVSELLSVAGDAVVVVIGLPARSDGQRARTADDWYVIAGDRGQSVRIDSNAAELASTLRYLVGVSGAGSFSSASPVHAVAARYWRRPHRGSSIAVTPPGSEIPLTVDSLRNLGALAPPDA